MAPSPGDQLIERYLRRLADAATPLPAAQRDDLLGDIREHITVALEDEGQRNETAVRSVLARLGRPEDIVAAAAAGRPAPQPTAPDGSTRGGPLEWSALVLLLASGYLMPPLGWMIGAFLVVFSHQWSRRDKLIGIIGIPLATMAVAVAVGYVSSAMPNVGPVEAVVLTAVPTGPVAALYLLWRLDSRFRTRRRSLA